MRPGGGQLTQRKWRGSEVKEQIYGEVKNWEICSIDVVVRMEYWFEVMKGVIFPKGVSC